MYIYIGWIEEFIRGVMIERLAGTEYNGGEAAVIIVIAKDKAEELLEVIRNGMDIQRGTYYQPQMRPEQHTQVHTTTNNDHRYQQPYQLLMNWLRLLNSKNYE